MSGLNRIAKGLSTTAETPAPPDEDWNDREVRQRAVEHAVQSARELWEKEVDRTATERARQTVMRWHVENNLPLPSALIAAVIGGQGNPE